MMIPDYIILVTALVMVAVSALQTSKEDVMDAFTGGNQDLFKNGKKVYGAELVLNRIMIVGSIVFFAMVIWSNSIDRFFN